MFVFFSLRLRLKEMICNGDRTERSPIQSVIIWVIDKKTNQSEHKAGKCLALNGKVRETRHSHSRSFSS